ncbi:MAG: IS110 family transposase [Acetobacteraceae bacterium]|nr:IS110 family transposase [Acetobacteraceae bacterium]
MTEIICGVDVASQTLDARIGRDGVWRQFTRTPEGTDALAAFCKEQQVTLVVMEATGGYERLAFAQLWAAGVAVAIANPRAVRRFADGMGVLEKTDRIDCGMIAWYAETRRLKPLQPASQTQQELLALVVRLRQLVEARVTQRNQRRLVSNARVQESFAAILAALTREIRKLETAIAEAIAVDPAWAALARAFRSIKGVADRTVARLLAQMPEIGAISNKAAAKLAGLAPIARDSGKQNGRRPVRGGREGVRSILFVVAEVVRRHEPDFAAFYRKLCAAGKPKKLVRIALARKLLVRLNAKARDIRATFAGAAAASA